ncbi:MAG: anaerobic ribonucleoside-triphosphate reductase activating protein [Chloroflexia bacterium]
MSGTRMDLRGWVRTSLLDFPGRISTVLFTGGCNFRCPPCQNAGLVLHPETYPRIEEQDVRAFLERRKRRVEGVVLTGGEPTVQPDLLEFLRQMKEMDLAVKLDTNGYRPEVLESALEEGLVDYVALDVKAPPEKYALLAGRPDLDLSRIERSIALLREGRVAYEFRTTVVPGLLDQHDVEAIAHWLGGASLYVLQPFRPHSTLDPTLQTLAPYPAEWFRAVAASIQPHVRRVEVRVM